jgi:hypothetical protein
LSVAPLVTYYRNPLQAHNGEFVSGTVKTVERDNRENNFVAHVEYEEMAASRQACKLSCKGLRYAQGLGGQSFVVGSSRCHVDRF